MAEACHWSAVEMASNKGQSSCVVYLWIFFLAVGIVPGVVSNVELTSIPSTIEQICPGETIEFTCITESSILSWTSDEYIGVGSPLEFLSINPIGTIRNSTTNANTIANLTDINGGILTSTLRVVTSRSSTITCINVDDRMTAISLVLIGAVPGAPQNVTAVGSMDDCMIQVTWDPPADIGGSDYTYRVDVPSRNITTNINSSTESTLHVPNCIDGIPIQVYAVNRFDCMRPNGALLRLQSGSTTTAPSGLPVQVVGGIIGGVCAFFIIIAGVCAIFCLVLKREAKKRHERTEALELQKQELLKDEFVSHLGLLYETLKRNIPSLMKEVAVRKLLKSMSKERMSSNSIKAALREVLETRVASARGVRLAVQQLKTMTPEVMSAFDAELGKVNSTITMDKLSALIDRDDHKQPRDELIRLVDQTLPKNIKGLLQQLFEALRDYDSEAENQDEVQKALKELEKTVESCTMGSKIIKDILVDATEKLLPRRPLRPNARRGGSGNPQWIYRPPIIDDDSDDSDELQRPISDTESESEEEPSNTRPRDDDTESKSEEESCSTCCPFYRGHQQPSSSAKKSKESKKKDGGDVIVVVEDSI